MRDALGIGASKDTLTKRKLWKAEKIRTPDPIMMATYSKSSDIKLCQEIVDACNRVLESSKYFQNI